MSKSIGRPLEFDPADVLPQILGVFWEHGYARTSLSRIEAATGVSRPSLYNTFGDKRALFEKATSAYYDSMEVFVDEHLRNRDDGLEALVHFIEALLIEYTAGDQTSGCLLVNAMADFGTTDSFVGDVTTRYTELLSNGIATALRRAATQGEVDPDSIDELTRRMVLLLFGLNVMARSTGGGASIESFATSATGAIRGWRIG